jgi:hypothetical protein
MRARLATISKRDADQPPDREDDKDQPEYATNLSGLTVIATAVKPKPATKENHEQQDDQNSSIGLYFIRFVGNPCRAAVGSFSLGRSSRP